MLLVWKEVRIQKFKLGYKYEPLERLLSIKASAQLRAGTRPDVSRTVFKIFGGTGSKLAGSIL